MSSLPDSWMNVSPQARRCAVTRPRLPVASFTPTTFGSRAISAMVSTEMSTTVRRRHVVDDDRQRRRLRRARGKWRSMPAWLGLIVIANHDERRVGADILRGLHLLDGDCGRIASAAGDDRNAPGRDLRPSIRSPGVVRGFDSVALSPVVPHGTSAVRPPSAICHSTNPRSESSSTHLPEKGVTSAGIDP